MIILILLIGHLCADFIFQPSSLAFKKQEKFRWLLLHSAVYLTVLGGISFLILEFKYALITSLIISITHFLIDWLRCKTDSKYKNGIIRFISFIIDQILHSGIIILSYYTLELNTKGNTIFETCITYPIFDEIILYSFLFITLLNPSAVFIKKLFTALFANETQEVSKNSKKSKKDNKESKTNSSISAGGIIGELERLIIALLLLCNQYAVIGIVLTAKSIARYKQLEDQNFAEKYLVGTLTSVLISLVLTIGVKYIITII